MAAACVEAAAPPAAAAVARATRKRTRIAMGSADDYEEICCLGMGAFGRVLKARHRTTGQTVAIKRPTSESAAPGSRVDLLREASMLQASSHENPFVVGFHGLARSRDSMSSSMDLCLVMECVAGRTLSALLHDHRRHDGTTTTTSTLLPPELPEATVRAVMWQLLTGARKMHDVARVVHRDIKPDNILVADADRTGTAAACVKICDFGLAMFADDPPPHDRAGTLWYMAPEVLLGKPDYGAEVDAWSLGCVMAELVAGHPLFVASTAEDQLAVIFDVLGAPDEKAWPWFASTPFAARLKLTMPPTELMMNSYKKTRSSSSNRNLLREEFPKRKLSAQGFKLLSGLLTCNPDKRLTAAAALNHPWFAKMNAPELLQKKRQQVSSTLPKIKRIRVLCP